jgi:hypothetical protein
MNILLVEDNSIKKTVIQSTLLKINPEAKIRTFNNLRDSEFFLDRNHELTDLIVLDWCFPENKTERPRPAMGRRMLDYIKENKYGVKTIICSGDEINMDELQEYYFLLGSVLFGKSNAGVEIYNMYLDYWKNVSELYRRPIFNQDKPLEKKLVNSDVK